MNRVALLIMPLLIPALLMLLTACDSQPAGPAADKPVEPAAEKPPEEMPVEAPEAAKVTEKAETGESAGERTYVVSESDWSGFWGIARKVYGDGKHWEVIKAANPDVDATRLSVGTVLKIPALPREQETKPAK